MDEWTGEPGREALEAMQAMYKTDFAESVVVALESKVAIRAAYPSSLENRQLATL